MVKRFKMIKIVLNYNCDHNSTSTDSFHMTKDTGSLLGECCTPTLAKQTLFATELQSALIKPLKK